MPSPTTLVDRFDKRRHSLTKGTIVKYNDGGLGVIIDDKGTLSIPVTDDEDLGDDEGRWCASSWIAIPDLSSLKAGNRGIPITVQWENLNFDDSVYKSRFDLFYNAHMHGPSFIIESLSDPFSKMRKMARREARRYSEVNCAFIPFKVTSVTGFVGVRGNFDGLMSSGGEVSWQHHPLRTKHRCFLAIAGNHKTLDLYL